MKRISTATALAIAVVLAPAAAHAASPVTIGAGHKPGVAVDAAGTAYIAWYGPEAGVTSLRFCRLPRGASACDAASTIPVPGGTSGTRPFVAVTGATVRVAQYRYAFSSGDFGQVWVFVSTNRGATFVADHQIGVLPFDEAVHGPGDTITAAKAVGGVDGAVVQNMPLAAGSAGLARAFLSSAHHYDGTVALVDATTPLAVFTDGSASAMFRRYSGSGSLNTEASWTPAVPIGTMYYPRLAGGPSGLFLLSATAGNALVVRKWNGTTFAPGVVMGDTREAAQDHLAQDPGGRLHAVYGRGSELVHATSDDGVGWQSGTLLHQTDGGIGYLRAAAASDHVGVAVWEAGTTTGPQIRVAAIGPTAPVNTPPPPDTGTPIPTPTPTPAAKRKPSISATGSAKRRGKKVRIRISGQLVLPTGVTKTSGCTGTVRVTIKRGRKAVVAKTVAVRASCKFGLERAVKRSKVKRAKKLAVVLRFGGNDVLTPLNRSGSLTVKRR